MNDRAALSKAARDVSSPQSPTYRHYITPAALAQRFGASESQYQSVVDWAQANHLTVGTHTNRLAVTVTGSVEILEAALNVRFNVALRPDGTEFYTVDREPSLDLSVPVEHIDNLNDYIAPRHASAGTGTGGSFQGSDLRTAYLSCTALTGSGQTIGILDGGNECYLQSDVTAFAKQMGFASPPPVKPNNLGTEASNGTCTVGNSPGTEITIDIEMATAMAPAAQVVVFGTTTYDSALLQMVDSPAKQFTSSWYPTYDAAGEAYLNEMALQGQTFFQITGDGGAYTATNGPTTPMEGREQAVTLVGGTELSTSGAGGPWLSESTWPHSSGGILSVGGGVPLPEYQQGINTSANQASTIYRNAPDVSMAAANLQIRINTAWEGEVGGTSCASPLWAGFMALVNETAAANAYPSVGFANPALYSLAWGSLYGTYFHDVTAGSNPTSECGDCSPMPSCCQYTSYNAAPGYDLTTGLGSPQCALIGGLAFPSLSWSQANWNLSCATSIAASMSQNTWAISCTPWQSGSSDYSIWWSSGGEQWYQAPGGARHVAESPSGAVWILNNAGTAFMGYGDGWTAMNSGTGNPYNHLTSIAAGPDNSCGSTAWATSATPWTSGSPDFSIYNYNVQSCNAWTLAVQGGGGVQVGVSPTGTPWLLNHEGALFNSTAGTSWTPVSAGPTFSSFGVGPNNAAYAIGTTPWKSGSNDYSIYGLTAYNSSGDAAWSAEPGGARQISVDALGNPWLVNAEGAIFFAQFVGH